MGFTGEDADFFAGSGQFLHKSHMYAIFTGSPPALDVFGVSNICNDPDAWSDVALPFSLTKR